MSAIPSHGRQTVTAFFDSKADAERASERIRELGVSSADIRLVSGDGLSEGGRMTGERKGFLDSLADFFMPDEDRHAYAEGLRRGGYLLTVTTADTVHERVLDILDDDGTVDMDEREASWRSEGWSGYASDTAGSGQGSYGQASANAAEAGPAGAAYGARTASLAGDRDVIGRSSTAYEADRGSIGSAAFRSTGSSHEGTGAVVTGTNTTAQAYGGRSGLADEGFEARERDGTIDVVEERLRVGKRDVSHGRVRVRSYVVEEPVQEEVGLHSERVEIERRPVDRAVDAADTAFIDRTLELEETAQEAVVSKEARVKEEIDLRRVGADRTETVSDTVRRTEVEIEDDRRSKSLAGEEVVRQTAARKV